MDLTTECITFEPTENGYWLWNKPIVESEFTVPFVFSRASNPQPDAPAPNEVVMWGQNLGLGGNAIVTGLPAIGYSLESSYYPDPETRLVEGHMFYITPAGGQIRLQSYTVTTTSNRIDFYHTAGTWSIKNPGTGNQFVAIDTDENDNGKLQLQGYGNWFYMGSTNETIFSIGPSVQSAGLALNVTGFDRFQTKVIDADYNDGQPYLRITGDLGFAQDNVYTIGDYASRVKTLYVTSLHSSNTLFGSLSNWGRDPGPYPITIYPESNLRGAISMAVLNLDINFRQLTICSDGAMKISPAGSSGLPTAYLHLAAGTAGEGTAPLKLTPGTNLDTPENGVFEYDGTDLFFTVGSTRKVVTLI